MDTSKTNEAQIEYWNNKSGLKWVKHQATLDRQIGPHGEAMLKDANPQEGEVVLDIGCGCGAVTLDVAGRIGDSGRATGVDISAPMLAHARSRAAEGDIKNANFIQADAQVHDLPRGSFDLAVSRFGVMFFADPVAAFANIRRGLKPSGRLAFVCWRPPTENPWMMLPVMEASRFVEMPPRPDPDEPGPFSLADKAKVERILCEAGFEGIGVMSLEIPMALGDLSDPDSPLDLIFEIGPLSRMLADASDDVRAKVRDAVEALFAKHSTDTGVAMDSAAWIVTARNPE